MNNSWIILYLQISYKPLILILIIGILSQFHRLYPACWQHLSLSLGLLTHQVVVAYIHPNLLRSICSACFRFLIRRVPTFIILFQSQSLQLYPFLDVSDPSGCQCGSHPYLIFRNSLRYPKDTNAQNLQSRHKCSYNHYSLVTNHRLS